MIFGLRNFAFLHKLHEVFLTGQAHTFVCLWDYLGDVFLRKRGLQNWNVLRLEVPFVKSDDLLIHHLHDGVQNLLGIVCFHPLIRGLGLFLVQAHLLTLGCYHFDFISFWELSGPFRSLREVRLVPRIFACGFLPFLKKKQFKPRILSYMVFLLFRIVRFFRKVFILNIYEVKTFRDLLLFLSILILNDFKRHWFFLVLNWQRLFRLSLRVNRGRFMVFQIWRAHVISARKRILRLFLKPFLGSLLLFALGRSYYPEIWIV